MHNIIYFKSKNVKKRFNLQYFLILCIHGVSKKVYSLEKVPNLISARGLRKSFVKIGSSDNVLWFIVE